VQQPRENNAVGGSFRGTSVARLYQTLLGSVQTTRFMGGFDCLFGFEIDKTQTLALFLA